MNEMNYAVVENGTVTNNIWLYPANASDFPSAVPCGDLPVAIGDTYDGEHFTGAGCRCFPLWNRPRRTRRTCKRRLLFWAWKKTRR